MTMGTSTRLPRSILHACAAFFAIALPVAATVKAPFQEAHMHAILGSYYGVTLRAYNGMWEPVCRAKPSFNQVSVGYITRSEGTPENFTVWMQLEVDGGHQPGGHVFYEIHFVRKPDGSYGGSYKETRGSNTGSSEDLVAEMYPKQNYSKEGHVPIQPGEHPRLLIRKSEIPALRAKLKTPFGQAFLAKAKNSKDMVVLATLYQATGDKKYADLAMTALKRGGDIDQNGGLTGDIGHHIVRVVTTIDLCYGAWPKEYTESLLRQIKARLPKRQYDLIIGHANYNQVSNYYGPAFGSAAIASMLLYGRKGPAPVPPIKPLCVVYKDCRIPPLTGYTPPPGVKTVTLVDDKVPTEWIYAGGFKPPDGMDMLKPLGGAAKARPTLNDSLTDGRKTQKFKPLSHEPDKGYFDWHGHKTVDVTSAIGRIYHSESCFSTVLRNETPGWYQYNVGTDHKESFTYVNGVLVKQGDLMQLDKGLYTVLIKVRIGQTEPWGREMLAARFTSLKKSRDKQLRRGQTGVDEFNAKIRAGYNQAEEFHETQMAEWKARGEQDLECLRMFYKGREQMFWHYRFGIGDGGFQAEATHYGNIAARYPMLYAAFYRNAFAQDVSPFPDTTHLLPRQMMQASFIGKKPAIMHLNVKGHFDHRTCTDHFRLVPDKWQPSLLWGWNRISDVQIDSAAKLDRAAADKILGSVSGSHLASTFVNYPINMDPVHPSTGMPKTWAAPTLGFYVFRNGWTGRDDIIAQIFAKSIPIRAWNHPNCGAFRLWGLGRAWTSAPIERSGYRPEESIVLTQDDVINESACGKIAHYDTKPDGSGSLLIDMTDVYLAAKRPEPKKKKKSLIDDLEGSLKAKDEEEDFGIGDAIKDMPTTKSVQSFYKARDDAALRRTIPKLYNWWGRKYQEKPHPSHVDGDRAFAFDFSEKCGAPCLMAIHDSIRGGKTKQWLWQLPHGDTIVAKATDNTFTIERDGVTLKGTVVSPSPIRARFRRKVPMHFTYRGGSKGGQRITRYFNFIEVLSTAKDVDFFVVLTLQRSKAPQVKIAGKGKDVVATVGQSRVRMDGPKVIIE